MRKFEYNIRLNLSDSELNKYGLEGWELISVYKDYNTMFYFKREIL